MQLAALVALALAPGVLAESVQKVPAPGCFCPKNYDPVCGSDFNTYGNKCEAQCAGVTVLSEGKCPEKCIAKCPINIQPACGADGNTYPSDCVAACFGVKTVSQGACPPKDDCCKKGHFCCESQCVPDGTVFKRPCGPSKCCDDPPIDKCCTKDKPVCMCEQCWDADTALLLACPEKEGETCCKACTKEYEPVCGDDGNTYPNKCHAEQADVEIACEGKCPCKPVIDKCCTKDKPDCVCGKCTRVGPFGPRPFCDTTAPKSCCRICPAVFDPVCGKNGKTYGNKCEAGDEPIACEGKCPCKENCCPKETPICCGTDCYSHEDSLHIKCARPGNCACKGR